MWAHNENYHTLLVGLGKRLKTHCSRRILQSKQNSKKCKEKARRGKTTASIKETAELACSLSGPPLARLPPFPAVTHSSLAFTAAILWRSLAPPLSQCLSNFLYAGAFVLTPRIGIVMPSYLVSPVLMLECKQFTVETA